MSQNYEYFGKYILLEKLATGGMAEVWLARAPGAGGIGKFVAIKKILPQFSDNPEFIQMFRDEAAIAMNLSHSNIVSIYEFGQEKNQLFLVMDYVEGRNLRQILNKMKQSAHKFSIEQVLFMVKEVSAGLDHAHRSLNSATGKPLNITHRDMSPQNIMITFEGEVRIVDFGIAKAESQLENTKTGTLKGKFGYMSPEQAEGLETDLRTDIFSLGICLWELLANDRLFIANNEINTLRKIRDCNIPSLTKINPNISPELEKIVLKGLTRDRNLRYQTASAMHRDLNRFLNRQYPDFTPHDFSVSIKTLYADEILEIRKRLVEYAKIPFRPTTARNEDFDRTLVTSFPQQDAATKAGSTQSQLNVNPARTVPDISITVTEGSGLNPKEATGTVSDDTQAPTATQEGNTISLAQQIPGDVLDTKRLSKNLSQPLRTEKTQKIDLALSNSGPFKVPRGDRSRSETRRPSSSRPREQQQVQYSSRSAINFMVFVACTIITYVVASTFFPKESELIVRELASVLQLNSTKDRSQKNRGIEDKNLSEKDIIEVTPGEVIANPEAPQLTYDFVVNSIPSGAEIYLNGLNTGKTTPSRISAPENKPFQIALKLPRFIEYTRSDLTREITGRSFTATLQKALVAYIDIDVKPARNAIVTVNGTTLTGESLPIIKYAIPAGTPITVRAENPTTGAANEEVVRLLEDQRYRVILTLDPKKRSPSHTQPDQE